MGYIALMTLAGLLAEAGPATNHARKELDRLQGKWNVLAVEVEGQRLPAEKTLSWKLRIWPLASTRLVATLVEMAVVNTIDVRAPRTIVPIAVATISSTRV